MQVVAPSLSISDTDTFWLSYLSNLVEIRDVDPEQQTLNNDILIYYKNISRVRMVFDVSS